MLNKWNTLVSRPNGGELWFVTDLHCVDLRMGTGRDLIGGLLRECEGITSGAIAGTANNTNTDKILVMISAGRYSLYVWVWLLRAQVCHGDSNITTLRLLV